MNLNVLGDALPLLTTTASKIFQNTIWIFCFESLTNYAKPTLLLLVHTFHQTISFNAKCMNGKFYPFAKYCNNTHAPSALLNPNNCNGQSIRCIINSSKDLILWNENENFCLILLKIFTPHDDIISWILHSLYLLSWFYK